MSGHERQAAMSGVRTSVPPAQSPIPPEVVRAEDAVTALAWVTCASCKTEYVCTPQRDYYNATTDSDGLCLDCLLSRSGMAGAKVIDARDPDDPRMRP